MSEFFASDRYLLLLESAILALHNHGFGTEEIVVRLKTSVQPDGLAVRSITTEKVEAMLRDAQRKEQERERERAKADEVRPTHIEAPMGIRLSKYTGYLKPWRKAIVEMYLRGLTPSKIKAEILPELMECGANPWGITPSTQMIEYVLRRVGAMPLRSGEPVELSPTGPELYAVALHDQGFTFAEIGRRLGCSRGAARMLIVKYQNKENRKARREHHDRRIEQFLAEQTERVRVEPTNRGRPIDMGGPRDVWIERDPWSDL